MSLNTCPHCGGALGRDCFNVQECGEITASMAQECDHQPDERTYRLAVSFALNTYVQERDFIIDTLPPLDRIAPERAARDKFMDVAMKSPMRELNGHHD